MNDDGLPPVRYSARPTAIPVVPAISGIAGTQRHLAVAGHRFSSCGRHHARPVRAVLVANQSGAVRRVLPMQLAATAHCGQPVPANVPPAGGLHNPVHPGMAEVRYPPQRRVHEHHRIIGRARHFGCDRHCVRHQTHSMAYAIADSHRFLLVLLRRGRVAMAIHPSAFQAAHQLLLTPHVPSVHRRQLDVGRWSPAVPVRGARLYRHASVRRIAAAYVAYAWVRPYLCQAVAQPHRCVCDWLCADAGRHPDRSSRESTRVLTRYAGCSPIRGRCLPDMAPAISSTRYGPARSMQDDC